MNHKVFKEEHEIVMSYQEMKALDAQFRPVRSDPVSEYFKSDISTTNLLTWEQYDQEKDL